MDSGMGMNGGMGTMMGMDGGMGMGNIATSTGIEPIRNVIKGAVKIPYKAGSESVMTVTDVVQKLTDLKVVDATRETVMDAAIIVQEAGDNAVKLVTSLLPNQLSYQAKKVASIFRTMDMRH